MLAKPTWSVRSLLKSTASEDELSALNEKKLQHLLQLSALPPAENTVDAQKMLSTLRSQLGFVKDVQSVNTEGVPPLQALRDETGEGLIESSLGVESVKHALEEEVVVGKHYKRLRSKSRGTSNNQSGSWDVLGHAERKVGNYFVVESEKIG